MDYTTITYETRGRIATITLNRPDKYNTIRPPMPDEVDAAIGAATLDRGISVIILQSAGKSFCGGFDFSDDFRHFEHLGISSDPATHDPGMDMLSSLSPHLAPVQKFMAIWRCPKPVIVKIHGWCVGGGSEFALLGDIVIASHDARIGTPYSRIWGCHLTGMWIYRLGLTRAKHYALTGKPVSGKEAVDIGLINFSYPQEELDARVRAYAEELAQIPVTQLAAMKFITNQVFDRLGVQHTALLGPVIDGIMRNTPEGREFVRVAADEGVGAAVAKRDAPFGDYSQGGKDMKPDIYNNKARTRKAAGRRPSRTPRGPRGA